MIDTFDKESQPLRDCGLDSDPLSLTNEEEFTASKFRKMLKIGVPPVSVKDKMKRAGVDSKIISVLLAKEGVSDETESAVPRTAEPPVAIPDAKQSEASNARSKCPITMTNFESWGVSVDPRNPTFAWETMLKDNLPPLQVVDVVANDKYDSDDAPPVHTGGQPCPDGHSRWVCVSDTHGAHGRMAYPVPAGDVLIHAGDFSRMGEMRELEQFCEWMRSLPHEHKIVIAGNHDVAMDESFNASGFYKLFHLFNNKAVDNNRAARELVRSYDAFTYLEDTSTEVLGYKIYGSPWQPEFCNWAFNLPRGPDCASKWRDIPNDTDILVTHGPPVGHGDLCTSGLRAGCVDLLAEILKRAKKPISHHIFGHIHEGYGCTRMGDTLFLNASTCTFGYRPSNPPLVFDLPSKFKNEMYKSF
mmetsp:Transcript_24397/g.51126  ORF Transcript_24397/g.51126 Transcript_24397/m.51126 type:complete len:415 (+) Transcript_24397:105-1349(+)